MHCQSDDPIPLKDGSSETEQQRLMNIPLLAKKKAQQCRFNDGEKKVHAAIVPNDNDILLGRGGKNNTHVGNEKLRELARKVADQYHSSSKKEKSYLSRTLVQKVREMDPPGRFLRRHPKENYWEDMSHDEDKCREKCAQVLRDAVAFVGLKDPPPPRMAQREELPFSLSDNTLAMQTQMLQQPMQLQMQMNPFAMSANTSNQILRHQQQMLARNFPSRHYSFQSYNEPQVTRLSLASSTGNYDLVGYPTDPGYASLPSSLPPDVPRSIRVHSGMPTLHGDGRPPKRPRRISNPFFDPFAPIPGEAAYGYDRRWSLASNSFADGADFSSRTIPGPRFAAARRDSLFGNVSLGAIGSDHSAREFELFPDIGENVDTVPPTNDNDEFASDFC